MTDFVSFETAVLLEAKGFLQPETSFGQVWYFLHNAQPVLIGSALGNEVGKYKAVFAPRAADLLQALDIHHSLCVEAGVFELRWHREHETVAQGENPAEMIAMYFLS